MSEDILLTMRKDLERVISQKKKRYEWAMIIDLRKCVGCHACTVGCMAENVLPPGIIYRPVFDEVNGTYPKLKRRFIPRPCQQCDNPPCVSVCPVKGKATWKSKEGISSGIVMIDYNECIGCGRCVEACPYKVRALDLGQFHSENAPFVPEYEKRPNFEYMKQWPRTKDEDPIGKARKCHFCLHRIAQGMLPMCVTTCIGRANYFGDLSDKDSLVYKIYQENKNNLKTLVKVTDPTPIYGKAVFGKSKTKPRVFYIDIA
jgi:molybdopterin-containing oxidoreductase family iron-sulfur binding subunit